jgi:pimeloyl-ACP methyl ester carboxylesterase
MMRGARVPSEEAENGAVELLGRRGGGADVDSAPAYPAATAGLALIGLAAEGRLTAAVRAFAGFPFTDEDIAVAEDAGYFGAVGRYVPNVLDFVHQQMEYEGPTDDDPAVLGAISVPVLVLRGSHTKPYAIRSARHVADHAPNARVHQISCRNQARFVRTCSGAFGPGITDTTAGCPNGNCGAAAPSGTPWRRRAASIRRARLSTSASR